MSEHAPHGSVARTPSTTRRFRCWQLCVAILLLGQPAWFFLLRGPRILDNDTILFAGWIGFSRVIALVAWLLKTTPPDAIKLPVKRSVWIILLGAMWLHGCAIHSLRPGLSDDVLRYRSDGQLWRSGWSPYSLTPLEFNKNKDLLSFPRRDSLDAAVPYRSVHTIYLPTSQLIFYALHRMDLQRPIYGMLNPPYPFHEWKHLSALRSDDANAGNHVWREIQRRGDFDANVTPWRVAFALMTIAATGFVLFACIRLGRSPWYAALFGWHPLAIVETAGMAHQDAIGILCLSIAAYAWVRWGNNSFARTADNKPVLPASESPPGATLPATKKNLDYAPTRPHRTWDFSPLAGVFLALACGVKPIALVIAPFWFIARSSFKWVIPFCITGLLLGSMLLYQNGYIGFLATLKIYTQQWEANGSVFHLIRTFAPPVWIHGRWIPIELFIEPQQLGRMLAGVVVGAVAIGLVIGRAHWTTACYWIVLTSLLMAPVVYPWYLLWLLVIVPFTTRYGLTAMIFSATVVLNYHLWRTPDWVMPWPWLALEYAPVYAALVYELLSIRSQPKPADNR